MAHDQTLRKLLDEEQTWLLRAQDLVRQVQRFREARDQPFLAGRVATMGRGGGAGLGGGMAGGAGYVWLGHPYEVELASLRGRAEVADALTQRMLRFTPAERKQFLTLMNWNDPPQR